ncbi:MAG: hypothetical protein Q8Q59_12410 [Luteolibacter sp.]|jgi:hypothetical protein|nr:hypothetical protein [Luteolibacter sp.]
MKCKCIALLAGLLSALPAGARETRVLRVPADTSTLFPAQAPQIGRVVLVHGFLETGVNFNTMRKRLQKSGYECLVPRLRPSDGRGGLEALAEGLKRDIDAASVPSNRFPSSPSAWAAWSAGNTCNAWMARRAARG